MALVPEAVRKTLRELVAGKAPWPLTLTGPVGVGKTCTALALLDYSGGCYKTATGLCEALIECQQGRMDWYKEGRGCTIRPRMFWRILSEEPLVVLDELGIRGAVTDHHYEAVKTLIEERHRKPLIVISNLDLAAVARVYDARIASRLAAGTVLEMVGPDRRLS